MITYLLIGSALIVLALLFYIYFSKSILPKQRPKETPKETAAPQVFKGPCILCNTPLGKGERIKSQVFKGEKDSIVRVMGCPHCHGPGATKDRTCPVCKKKMAKDNYLQGRMWLKKSGKQHLHISGCTACMGRKA